MPSESFKLAPSPEPKPWQRFTECSAVLSEDRLHRHILRRGWHDDWIDVVVIGVNPSVADEEHPDPTVQAMSEILNHNGVGRMRIVNLFDYITPYPEELARRGFPHRDKGDEWIRMGVAEAGYVVFAWGALADSKWSLEQRAVAKKRAAEVVTLVTGLIAERVEECRKPLCFTHTKNGQPGHPLYLKRTTALRPY
jgi:hypothetical protein